MVVTCYWNIELSTKRILLFNGLVPQMYHIDIESIQPEDFENRFWQENEFCTENFNRIFLGQCELDVTTEQL